MRWLSISRFCRASVSDAIETATLTEAFHRNALQHLT
jgi:hypothetical protein